MSDVNWDKVVRVYQKIKASYAEEQARWTAVEADYKSKLEDLQNFMLDEMNKSGVDTLGTALGTVYRKKKVIPQGSDWDAFYKWVGENDAFDFLERRIKAKSITDYMEEHENALPPGVSVFTKYDVGVRRK
jgi:hypothetical protein